MGTTPPEASRTPMRCDTNSCCTRISKPVSCILLLTNSKETISSCILGTVMVNKWTMSGITTERTARRCGPIKHHAGHIQGGWGPLRQVRRLRVGHRRAGLEDRADRPLIRLREGEARHRTRRSDRARREFQGPCRPLHARSVASSVALRVFGRAPPAFVLYTIFFFS